MAFIYTVIVLTAGNPDFCIKFENPVWTLSIRRLGAGKRKPEIT